MNVKNYIGICFVFVLALAALSATAIPAAASDGGVLFVDKDAPGPTHNGLSWTTAFTTVQAALDYTNIHITLTYEIWVAEGVYYPDEGGNHINNAMTETFLIHWDNVRLYGGFAATETLRVERDWIAHPTILSGDIDGNDVTVNGVVTVSTAITGANAYHVMWLDGVAHEKITSVTVIDGVTITAGNANVIDSMEGFGGGIYCDGYEFGRECSPTLNHVIFSGNAAHYGGGMYNAGGYYGKSNPTLTAVTFSGNSAEGHGGGMYNEGRSGMSNPTLFNVTFSDNVAFDGGGMYNSGRFDGESNPTLTNVIFNGNYASSCGGGMHNYGHFGSENNPILTNVVFLNNTAALGGGMYNNCAAYGESIPRLINVTFVGNAASHGGAMYNEDSGQEYGYNTPILINCILWGNVGGEIFNDYATPLVTYSDIQDWTDGGVGNLNTDPQFVDAPGGDLRLLPTSPAIDAGDPNTCPAEDLRGEPRDDLRCDMGAFELRHDDSDTVTKSNFAGGVPYSFGPTRISVTLATTDTGALTVTKYLTYPGGTSDSGEVLATWWITGSLSAGLPATLAFCYTDEEIEGLNEASLRVSRWNGIQWTVPISTGLTVDAARNCVILAGVNQFSAWTLYAAGGGAPTAVLLRGFAVRGGLWAVGVIVVSGFITIRLRRRLWVWLSDKTRQ